MREGLIGFARMSKEIRELEYAKADHNRETLRLAREYKAACDAVQTSWKAFLNGARQGADPFDKGEHWRAHRAAQDHARDRHRVLIEHVACGVLEVGQ